MPRTFNLDRNIKRRFAGLAKSKLSIVLLAAVAVLFFSTESRADTAGVCDGDSPGQCTGSVSLVGTTLTITLNNTSPPANGGYITAFAFNLTPGTVVNSFVATSANFNLFGPAPLNAWTGNVSPEADRTHLSSATSNDYNGGGNPSGGTPPGGTVTFTLTLAAVNGNTEAAIFGSALIRERGFEPDGSDKDAFLQRPVPEPASMLLLGTGLVGLAGLARRRFRNK